MFAAKKPQITFLNISLRIQLLFWKLLETGSGCCHVTKPEAEVRKKFRAESSWTDWSSRTWFLKILECTSALSPAMASDSSLTRQSISTFCQVSFIGHVFVSVIKIAICWPSAVGHWLSAVGLSEVTVPLAGLTEMAPSLTFNECFLKWRPCHFPVMALGFVVLIYLRVFQ